MSGAEKLVRGVTRGPGCAACGREQEAFGVWGGGGGGQRVWGVDVHWEVHAEWYKGLTRLNQNTLTSFNNGQYLNLI